MKKIPLTQGQFAIVDDNDFEELNKCKWYAQALRHGGFAAATRQSNKAVYMHRLVVEKHLGRRLRKTEIVHHIDDDTQNNAIKNLMLTTHKKHMEMHNFANRVSSGQKRMNSLKSLSSAVLCEADIPEVRQMIRDGRSYTEIGDEFGVGDTAIAKIKSGRHWSHVPE